MWRFNFIFIWVHVPVPYCNFAFQNICVLVCDFREIHLCKSSENLSLLYLWQPGEKLPIFSFKNTEILAQLLYDFQTVCIAQSFQKIFLEFRAWYLIWLSFLVLIWNILVRLLYTSNEMCIWNAILWISLVCKNNIFY